MASRAKRVGQAEGLRGEGPAFRQEGGIPPTECVSGGSGAKPPGKNTNIAFVYKDLLF